MDTCWFYPWKYQNKEDVWRGLIAEVILRAMRVEGVDSAKLLKAARQFGGFLGRGFIRLLGSANIKVGNSKATGFDADIDLKEAISGVMEEYGKHVTPQEAYFNEFENIFKGWVEDTYPSHGNRRLVVFIDDLDRCMPDIALQVLEALKLYLQVPNLIFVVGVERSVIDRIVHKRYSDLVGADVMADGFHEKAARYLDKMFTVEVNIEPTDEEVSEFFSKRVTSTPVWLAIPEEHRDRLRSVILSLGGRTPRSIVRLVNRVVIACGRRSENGSLNLAQELQRELLDAACQQLGYEDLPQWHSSGRSFFATWSQIIAENPGRKVIRLSPGELKARTANVEVETSYHESGQTISFAKSPNPWVIEPELRPEFDHLAPLTAPHFSQYHGLLTSLEIAKLLEIPYFSRSENQVFWDPPTGASPELTSEMWERLRELVAAAQGVDPSSLTNSDLQEVEQLSLSGTNLSGVSPLTALKSLTYLDLNATEVSDISPLAWLVRLEHLDCADTPVSDISCLEGLKELSFLSIPDTKVSDITPIKGLRNLHFLDLRFSRVADISAISNLTELRYLLLGGTSPSNFSPLEKLTELRMLHLADTAMEDTRPLRNLVNLQFLFLSSNPVSDISHLRGLVNLKHLHLSSTNVSDFDVLQDLPNLTYVELPDGTAWNPLSEPIPDKYNPKAR